MFMQPHLHAALRQRHPWIHVRRIIVVVDEDVVALAPVQSTGHITQRIRGRPDKCDFVGLRVEQMGRELAAAHDAGAGESVLLVTKRGEQRIIRHRIHDAPRQWTNAGVSQKNLLRDDGEFAAAQFLVGKDLSDGHGETWAEILGALRS